MKRSTKLLALSLITASTVSFAHGHHNNFKGETNFKDAVPCPVAPSLNGGFYVGAQAGYDSYRIRESFASPAIAGVSDAGTSVHNATGWLGGLFVGYGDYLTPAFYLGGEIFGNVSGAEAARHYTATDSVDGDAVSAYSKVESKGNYGLSIIPGYKINDTTLGYVRLGWNWARIKGSANSSVTENGVVAASSSGSGTNTQNGFAWGLGMETKLVDNWSVRTEYNHTYFNNRNSFDASDNQYSVGILYHFV